MNLLVNNSGRLTLTDLLEGDEANIRLTWRTHFFGTLSMMRAFRKVFWLSARCLADDAVPEVAAGFPGFVLNRLPVRAVLLAEGNNTTARRTTMKTMSRVLQGAAALALLGSLAACGDNDTEGTPAPAGDSVSSAPTAAGTVLNAGDSKLGKVLTDDKGLTLYTFDKDVAGKSNCLDMCLVNWPAVPGDAKLADGVGAGALSTITRPDGAAQAALDGKPIYRFIKDEMPGDTIGDGVMSVWHAVVIA